MLKPRLLLRVSLHHPRERSTLAPWMSRTATVKRKDRSAKYYFEHPCFTRLKWSGFLCWRLFYLWQCNPGPKEEKVQCWWCLQGEWKLEYKTHKFGFRPREKLAPRRSLLAHLGVLEGRVAPGVEFDPLVFVDKSCLNLYNTISTKRQHYWV